MPFVGKLGSTPRFILGQAFVRSAMLGTPAFMATKKKKKPATTAAAKPATTAPTGGATGAAKP